jgi:hypothetical protein
VHIQDVLLWLEDPRLVHSGPLVFEGTPEQRFALDEQDLDLIGLLAPDPDVPLEYGRKCLLVHN